MRYLFEESSTTSVISLAPSVEASRDCELELEEDLAEEAKPPPVVDLPEEDGLAVCEIAE